MRAHVSSSVKPVQSGRRVANVGGEEPLPLPKLLPLPVCGVVCARRTRPSAPSRLWRSRQLPNPSSAGPRLITQPAWDRHCAALYSEQLDPVRLAWPWTVATSIAPSVAESSRPISYMCPEIACAIEAEVCNASKSGRIEGHKISSTLTQTAHMAKNQLTAYPPHRPKTAPSSLSLPLHGGETESQTPII